ncbi:MAG: hypothetical protein KDB14_15360 [Planctomycetales bacterium]|nr:hypothetical protein [Planctomycetales bacterium]
MGQTLDNGIVGGNKGRNSDDYDQGYPRTELDSLPFTGRYHNSCYGPILIEENPAGITVTVNGRSVRAKDGAELRQRYPDAYRLYERTLGREKLLLLGRFAALKNSYSNANRALAGGGMSGPLDFNSRQGRSVSLMENGKKVSITETEAGIAVSVDGKRVRANSLSQLRKGFPEAFRMFEEQLAAADGGDGQPAVK